MLICRRFLPRFSSVICSVRRSVGTNVNQSSFEQILQHLSKTYRNELENLNENQIERNRYLKSTLNLFDQREKLVNDLNETRQLSRGTFVYDWIEKR